MDKHTRTDKRYAYYQSIFGRNVLNGAAIPAIVFFLSAPKLVLEVFMRRRMGERYFSMAWAVVMALVLFFLPAPLKRMFGWGGMTSYYIFLTAYVIMAVVRYLEIRRAPSVFDFARFSLDMGRSHDFFYKIRIFGKSPTQRMIDVWLEPIFCFLIGFILLLCYQFLVGMVIVFCALCYFLCNRIFAIRGDHFIMDKIDEIICNQDLNKTFVQGGEVSPRGVPFYGKKPTNQELREDLLPQLTSLDDDAAVAM